MIAVGAAFYIMYRFSQMIFILVVAIILGTAIRRAVDWLNRRAIARPAGVILVYLGLFSLAGSLVVLALPMFSGQVASFKQNLPVYYAGFSNSLLNSSIFIVQQIGIRLSNNAVQPAATTNGDAAQSLGQLAQSLAYD